MLSDKQKDKLLRREAGHFFEKAERFSDTGSAKFADWMGVKPKAVSRVFAGGKWKALQNEWLQSRLRKTMLEVYGKAKVREDFNHNKILTVFKVERKIFKQLVGDEWGALAMKLPTRHEVVLAALAHFVEINIPANELTAKLLFEYSGYRPGDGPWLSVPLRSAKMKLAAQQRDQLIEPPAEGDIHIFSGGYVDLDSLEWDLNLNRGLIRRASLRSDIADVAWPLLKEDLRERRIALVTVFFNYRSFMTAGELLDAEVPELRAATLEAVQRAWVGYGGTRHKFSDARAALGRLFVALYNLAEGDPSINREEMLKIAAWLKTKAKLPPQKSGGNFLSESELSQVIAACLIDIKAGTEFVKDGPTLLTMNALDHGPCNAAPVVDWAVALMLLVMVFTGMRRQSVVELRLHDWMQIRSEIYGIVWQHSKNGEESLAVMPVLIARLLDTYVKHTEKVRTEIGTKRVFLTSGRGGIWSRTLSNTSLAGYLSDFVERHGILRDGVPVTLNSTVLRRTYATHQLNLGRRLQWVQAQLGHTKIGNTKNYTQFDLYEHPAQVRGPLDSWGRRVLGLWHRPVNLEALTSEERMGLFSPRESGSEDQLFSNPGDLDTGDTQVARLHTCSTCEHLITGPEYLDQWETERTKREARLKKLESEHSGADVLGEELEAHGLFMENYDRVMKGSGK